jgi:tetratricopeptide (TPR) repeat protein
MNKIGFMQDLIRGINKLVESNASKEPAVSSVASTVAPSLKRAYIFLEDKNWKSADEYFEKVLDIDPENAQAYLGKMLSALHISKKEDLKNCEVPFDVEIDYKRVIRYGDDDLKNELKGYISHIKKRNEEARLEGIYIGAKRVMANSHFSPIEAYQDAAKRFASISGYKDSDDLYKECLEKAEDSRKDIIYDKAIKEINKATVESFNNAISLLKEIPGWRDSDKKIAYCENGIPDIKEAEEKKRIAREKEKETMRIAIQKALEKNKKRNIVALVSIFVVLVLTMVVIQIVANIKYDKILSHLDAGNNKEAYSILLTMDSAYKDCEALKESVKTALHEEARRYYIAGEAAKAAEYLLSCSIIDDIQKGYECVAQGNYSEAINTYGFIEIAIPNGVTKIDDYKFRGKSTLKSVIIPEGVKSIGRSAFCECTSLTNVTMPSTITEIGEYAFYNCQALQSIIIPDGVTSIGNFAFRECKSITSINIPAGVSRIGKNTFMDCDALLSVTIPYGVTSIGESAFNDCDALAEVIMSDSVSLIGSSAFYDCGVLQSVTFSNTLTSIGNYAFENCKLLNDLTIPSSVTSIGRGAFHNCVAMETVIFENTSGWTRGDRVMESSDLSDSSIAAELLTTYYGVQWKRN